MTFGKAFRIRRKSQGWSIPRLAVALGISTAELSRVENGHLLPWPGSKIDAACAVMNCVDKAEGLKQTALMETGIKKGWIS